MKKGWLSVLIPAYNPGPWLKVILDSVLEQMKEFPKTEIVVVDDGSTENLSWVKEYPVKFRRKRNGGEPAARNVCLDMAKGEYIQFIDADDEIYPNFLSVVFDNMEKGYDWVSYDWECDKHKEWALQNEGILRINCACWAYTFRADFIGETRFDESLRIGCDQPWLDAVLKEDSKHYHDHRIFYNYCWARNENSLCHKKARGEI